ncbi:hormonally up-regulated neu tumor-associated kinase homolog A [Brienomyrus brachyistius]|uniref:hormonally up-regulated neu tumor-associated kinase homolog A n=1 Tax=Brienomyrus brachyistius TaxID=42636 RepID=UPI0020B257CF|nr:hormonally up-regulated neu tumor-associated kinase homolog A [Brienomyrus brachyistius]XP_048840441.1 hormonally up-regulated neu tumor-associated kinase homolog A [Brienomyrus brachyistius]
MPAADREMVTDSTGAFGLRAPGCGGSDKLAPTSLSGSQSGDVLRNFYHTKRVGNYLIGRKLGEGSFAKVREGLHALTGEKVAVKVIDKRKAKKDSYVTKNLRREGQIQQMIRHPNITQLLDVLETENSYYLVMELCPGGNLMNRIYEKKRLEEKEAQKYVRQLIMAVEHLHRAGVVHRDLKIENLLLDENSNIKLIDFGLSNCAGILGYSDPFSTQCGSPAYAAPELLSRKKYGPKVDVWSIGVNMYAMLTGTLPFTVEPFNLRALHQKMVDKEMNPLPPQLSSAAVNLLKSLLEPDPSKRPNIHQVMSDSWLHLGSPQSGTPYLNRIHIEEINHTVLMHMTEKMGYKHSEVLSAVLTNRACHTLAVYFLLNSKMQRLSKEYREKEIVEDKKKPELFQTQWRKRIEKITIPPKQTPIYLAISKGPTKDKKQKMGLLRSITGGKSSNLGPGGSVASSSLEYLAIHPLFPRTPQPVRRLETQQSKGSEPSGGGLDMPTVNIATQSWDSTTGRQSAEPAPQVPVLKLTGGAFSPPRQNSAFTADNSYLKKATIPNPPVLVVAPQPKKAPTKIDCGTSTDSPSSPPGNPESPQHRSKFPSMGIGQILKKRSGPFSLRTELPLEIDSSEAPPPYHMETLLCTSGALKTLC